MRNRRGILLFRPMEHDESDRILRVEEEPSVRTALQALSLSRPDFRMASRFELIAFILAHQNGGTRADFPQRRAARPGADHKSSCRATDLPATDDQRRARRPHCTMWRVADCWRLNRRFAPLIACPESDGTWRAVACSLEWSVITDQRPMSC
jgi:hypothetical protein